MWYNRAELLSHNKIFNWVIGERGVGKSFSNKRSALLTAYKKKREFIYVRRTEVELKEVKKKFFDDLIAEGVLKGASCKIEGNETELELYLNNRLVGRAVALSAAGKVKSNPYPLVDEVFQDEFLIEKGKGRYLKDEVTLMLSLYETIFRKRRGIWIGAANATSVNNPYFNFFDIRPSLGQRFTKFDINDKIRGKHIIEFTDSAEFRESKMQTEFGEMMAALDYGKYMFNNEWLDDSKDFVCKMDGQANYVFTIYYKGVNYGIYYQPTKGRYHINKKYQPTCKTVFSFTTDDHKPNTLLFKTARQSPFIKRLQTAYDCGAVYFDYQQTKNVLYDIFKYT